MAIDFDTIDYCHLHLCISYEKRNRKEWNWRNEACYELISIIRNIVVVWLILRHIAESFSQYYVSHSIVYWIATHPHTAYNMWEHFVDSNRWLDSLSLSPCACINDTHIRCIYRYTTTTIAATIAFAAAARLLSVCIENVFFSFHFQHTNGAKVDWFSIICCCVLFLRFCFVVVVVIFIITFSCSFGIVRAALSCVGAMPFIYFIFAFVALFSSI